MEVVLCFVENSAAICLLIESLMIMPVGAKFDDEPLPGVGEESVQLMAQCRRARLAAGAFSAIFIFLQHFIDGLFIAPECSGIPASTPLARAKTRKTDVSHFFFILCLLY